ncbi:hypothetical protein V2J52_00475 [Georgenia sp. MJ173]
MLDRGPLARHLLQHPVAGEHRVGDPGVEAGVLPQAVHERDAVGGDEEPDGEDPDEERPHRQRGAHADALGGHPQRPGLPQHGPGPAEDVDEEHAEREGDERQVGQRQRPRRHAGGGDDPDQRQQVEQGRGDRVEHEHHGHRDDEHQGQLDRRVAPGE